MCQKLNGRNINIIKWAFVFLGYIGSIIFVIYLHEIEMTQVSKNELCMLVNLFTTGYQMRQIIISVLMFIVGYMIVVCAELDCSEAMKIALAMPTVVAIWGTTSIVVLLLGIPYTSVTNKAGIVYDEIARNCIIQFDDLFTDINFSKNLTDGLVQLFIAYAISIKMRG